MIHRILATNVVLKNMGVLDDSDCSFCNEMQDSIQHMFWDCGHVKAFWESFIRGVNTCHDHTMNLSLSAPLVILGYDKNVKSNGIFYYIILLAKFFIFKCKVNKTLPYYDNFKTYLKVKYEIEKYISMKSMTYNTFANEWFCFQSLVE